jgi:hypothetical protein
LSLIFSNLKQGLGVLATFHARDAIEMTNATKDMPIPMPPPIFCTSNIPAAHSNASDGMIAAGSHPST